MIDITIPKNNEADFIELASKLDLRKLYFLYNFDEYEYKLVKNHKNINVEIGFIVNQKNINKALKESKLLVVKSSDKDRYFIETNKIRLIYGFEEVYKRDYLHQRASGLDHVICNLLNKNNVVVGMSYGSLFNKNPETTSLIMGRMMQNIRLCQKYHVKTIIGSFSQKPMDLKASHDIMSLFAVLGMDGKNAKESLTRTL